VDEMSKFKIQVGAQAMDLTRPESAAIFLSAAENVDEWDLRWEHISKANNDVISEGFANTVRSHPWVVNTAMVLGIASPSGSVAS
jgi:hypothetical protein